MKKTALIFGLLTIGAMATDYSSLTLDELLALRGTIAIEDQEDFQAALINELETVDTATIATLLSTTAPTPQQGLNTQNSTLNLISFDENGDGLINEDEFDTAIAAKLDQNIEDGKLLLNADNMVEFSTLDINDDGLLDSTELLQLNQNSTTPTTTVQHRSSGSTRGRR